MANNEPKYYEDGPSIDKFVKFADFLESGCKEEEILFRGQQEDWPLLPKIARKELSLRYGPLAAEHDMFAQFVRESRPYLDRTLASNWDRLFLAQHYGLPTRLLDWTKNPLAALWFAVREPPEGKMSAVVWVYRMRLGRVLPKWVLDDQYILIEDILSRGLFADAVNVTGVLRPTHVTRRITAQLGLFTIHGYSSDAGGFIPFEQDPQAGSLTKIEIPPESFPNMRFELDRCGINEASLFPDLDGLCRRIQWIHTSLKDEVEDES